VVKVCYSRDNVLYFVNSLPCVLTFKVILRIRVFELEYMEALSFRIQYLFMKVLELVRALSNEN
jgi:hypothetical protein